DNPALFSTAPALDSAGNLTFTAAPNAFGTATITVELMDDGGTANGGVDTSAKQSFTITVNPVADTPSVTSATTSEDTQTTSGLGDVAAAATISVTPVNDAPSFALPSATATGSEDAPFSQAGFATSIKAGPSDEVGQTVTFVVTGNDNPALFSAGPSIDSTGR